MKAKTKSPLIENPLRVPGQSVEEEIQKVIRNQVQDRVLIVGMLLMAAFGEWSRWYFESPPVPLLMTIVALGAVVAVTPGLLRARKRLQRLRLGRDGERAVGQVLERLGVRGFHVFHDLVGPGWNIDHVLVGSRGIYAIDTKTLSKPSKGQSAVTYDAKGLKKPGYDLSHFLDQARAEASSLRRIILNELRLDFPVRPIVLMPGWFVKSDGTQPKDVWVLEPKAFLKWAASGSETLDAEDVQRVRRVISKYIRDSYRSSQD